MEPNADERKNSGMSLPDAYKSIRQWFLRNIPMLREQMGDNDYGRKSEALIRSLPPASQLSELEIRAVLGEVIYGNLEWAYHEMEGDYKMAAYAHGALEAAGLSSSINENEKQALKTSVLWPHLSINRN